ncbi:MAG: NfeD family protein, partial [Bacteroidales bacterium]
MNRSHLLFILLLTVMMPWVQVSSQEPENPFADESKTYRVYTFDIKEQIAPPVWHLTKKSLQKARDTAADLVLIHMNTYGGLMESADSIRTAILQSEIPVWVFIDNNAASAGALISIACVSIYMRPGANIGAATVVNQTGEALPDKYQSYMRSMLRSTAEARGRDPQIAEGMVDPRISIPGVTDSGKVITFTTSEAIKHGFCEGSAKNLQEVLNLAGIQNYEMIRHQLSTTDRIIRFLINPVVSGILIMIIIGGIYSGTF